MVFLLIHKNLRYKMYFKCCFFADSQKFTIENVFRMFFADSQEVENKSVGPRAVGRHLPREGRPRHHPDGLRQLQEGDERDQTVRDAHGLLRQSRELPGITIVQLQSYPTFYQSDELHFQNETVIVCFGGKK